MGEFQIDLASSGAAIYLIILFLYAVATTVFLPTPVEILPAVYSAVVDVWLQAIVLGLGKAVGAVIVFFVGAKVNRLLERWIGEHPLGARVLKGLEGFVRKTKWIGLTILLAIPFMSDTAVNYFYSILNEEGHAIGRRYFVLANFIGGVVRTYLFLWFLPSLLPR